MIRKFTVFCLVFSFSLFANSQALPSRIGAEVAAVVKTKVAARGFAANDPRFGATVSAVGGAIIQIATGVVITGTAPAWGTVLATVVVAGAVGYAVQSLANWIFNPDGTVSVKDSIKPIDPVLGPNQCYGDSTGVCVGSREEYCTALGGSEPNGLYYKLSPKFNNACDMWMNGALYSQGSPGQFGIRTGTPSTTSVPSSTKPVAQALQSLTPEEKAKPLPAKVIADLADAAFKQAASQPGYAGVPYSMSDPITELDVQAFRAANPSFQTATIGDLAANIPLSDPLGQVSDNPSTAVPVNPAASSPLTNLGADPGIGSPNLDAAPTGAQILRPLSQLMPDLRNFQVPAHQAQCPKPTFDILGKSIVMDGQCAILEGIRGELYNAMVLVFLLIALFIVLSA